MISNGVYYTGVPSKRSEGQEIVTLWMDGDLLNGIDAARTQLRGMPRSQFIRDAILERLHSMGIRVDPSKTTAPDRAGKGGYPAHKPTRAELNEKASKPKPNIRDSKGIPFSSEHSASLSTAATVGASLGEREDPKSGPSPSTGAPTSQKPARSYGSAKRSKSRPKAQALAPK